MVGEEHNPVARQRLHAAGEFQLQQHRHNGGGRELAAAHQIVNRRGRGAEQVGDLGARLTERGTRLVRLDPRRRGGLGGPGRVTSGERGFLAIPSRNG